MRIFSRKILTKRFAIFTINKSTNLNSCVILLCVTPVVVCSINDFVLNSQEMLAKASFSADKCKLVLIKPNICGLYHPSIEILSAIIRYFEERAEEIVIGETKSMIHDPETQFKRLGIKSLLDKFKTPLKTVDLSEDRIVRIKVPKPHVLKEIELPETCMKCDVLINLSKAGTHSTTTMTNALKNLFGLLPERRKYSTYHPLGMDNVIADIAQVVRPNLNITDIGTRMIIGKDALAVDIAACKFLGLDPLQIKHLRFASEDRGENLENFIRKIRTVDL